MSGLSSIITVLTAPYNVINNSMASSLDSQLSPHYINQINQTPNPDVIPDPTKPRECIECFGGSNGSKGTSNQIPEEKIMKADKGDTSKDKNLVGDSLVDTAIYDYLESKDDYYDNKNQMVDNTIPYDPLKSLVKDYLKDNISMYDNRGKYFDQYLFNKKFDEYIEQKNKERLLKEKVRLYDLNRIENIQVQPYELPLNKILINTKQTWFNMYDDVTNGKSPFVNLNFNSYFYIGMTLIVITLLFIMLTYIFN